MMGRFVGERPWSRSRSANHWAAPSAITHASEAILVRFLTRAWHAGDYSDEEADAVLSAYHVHRSAILPRLPNTLLMFSETVDVHDGLLRVATLNRADRTLQVGLRCGDLDKGYYDLDMSYIGIDLERLDVPVLKTIAEASRSEALYLEEDIVEPEWYVHRWLWWPFRRELDIDFADFTFTCEPRPDRDFAPVATPFVERGSASG